jgi:guanylate kinase
MPARRGIPFVISAPSGTGKTTVCREVVARDPAIVLSVSHTTRAPRPGERDGVNYHFVTPAQFRGMVSEGAFLEFAEYGGHLYGTSWTALEGPRKAGRDVLLEIEVQGGAQVRERLAEACLIFLVPPSFAELENRLRGRRTDDESVIQRRLAIAHQELQAVLRYDWVVENTVVSEAVDAVLAIIAGMRTGGVDAGLRDRFARDAALPRLRQRLPLPDTR